MDKIKYFHKHTGNRGGFTVAYIVHENGTIEWNYARCNEMDNFSRKIGRSIAESRFRHNKIRNNWVNATPFVFIANLAATSDELLSKKFPVSYHYF